MDWKSLQTPKLEERLLARLEGKAEPPPVTLAPSQPLPEARLDSATLKLEAELDEICSCRLMPSICAIHNPRLLAEAVESRCAALEWERDNVAEEIESEKVGELEQEKKDAEEERDALEKKCEAFESVLSILGPFKKLDDRTTKELEEACTKAGLDALDLEFEEEEEPCKKAKDGGRKSRGKKSHSERPKATATRSKSRRG